MPRRHPGSTLASHWPRVPSFVTHRTPDEADSGILPQVACGVDHAMDQCIKQYSSLVWSIARRHVGNDAAAEDVVQEIFTDIWKSAKRFNAEVASEVTFVGVLARRRAIDFARRESRQVTIEPLPDAELTSHASREASPALSCEGKDIREALKQLPDDTQQIFALHFDQGMTHPEIAERTGLPLGSVKTRLRRGLIRIRDILHRLDGGPTSNSANS